MRAIKYIKSLIADIFEGLFWSLIYKTKYYPLEQRLVVEQREKACIDCVLRDGNWCSRKKNVSVKNGKQVVTQYNFLDDEYKLVKGCGCWLIIKKFSKSLCPLNKWESFQTNV